MRMKIISSLPRECIREMVAAGMMGILWQRFCSPLDSRADVGTDSGDGALGQAAVVGSSVYVCVCICLLLNLCVNESKVMK